MERRIVKVAIDGSVLQSYEGGIARVTSQLILAMIESRPEWAIRVFGHSDRSNVSWHVGGRAARLMSIPAIFYRYLFWPQVVLPLKLLKYRPMMIISPNYVTPWLFRKRCIVIVHDASSFRVRQQQAGRNLRLRGWPVRLYHSFNRHMIRSAARSCACLVAPSEVTRERVRISVRKIRVPFVVIPWAAQADWGDLDLTKHVSKDLYLLAVNVHNASVLRQVAQAIDEINTSEGGSRSLSLRVVGHLTGDISSLGASVCQMGRVSESALKKLYAGALGVVVSTVENGFGLPVLEAMSLGVPCIVREGSAEAEVAGGLGAIECDGSVRGWVDAIKTLLKSGEFWTALGQEARVRSESFSWEAVGNAFAGLVEERYATRSADDTASH